jgi:alpha-galactosidase
MNFYNINVFPNNVFIETEDYYDNMTQKDSGKWSKDNIEVLLKPKNAFSQTISLSSPSIPIRRIHLRWNINISSDIKLLGDAWERGYGNQEWKNISLNNLMPWYFFMNDGKQTNSYGVKTTPNAMVFWQVDTKGISLWLDVRCGTRGVRLGDRVLEVATILTREGQPEENAFHSACAFCKELCDNPLIPSQPVYGGNNWYYAYGDSSHEEILNDTELIAELSEGLPNRPFMVVDDGWQLPHNENFNGGPWTGGNDKFPNMKLLADEIKHRKVRPGIWMRPLLTIEKLPFECILPDSRFINKEVRNKSELYMDPSHPDVLEIIALDMKRISSWGYELIKHDFSTYDIFGRWGFDMSATLTSGDWHFYDNSKTTAEIIKNLYQTIRNAVGKDILLIGCNTIGHLAAGTHEIQRTGDDTSGRVWERTRKMGINTVAFRNCQHENFYAVDGDCVGLTKDIDWFFNSQWLDLLAKSGTPLFVSASPDIIGSKEKQVLKEAFRLASTKLPVGEPVDWMTNNCPDQWRLNGELVEYNWYGNQGLFVGTFAMKEFMP